MAKACASHGSRKTGPFASRGICGSAFRRSGWLKIRLPAVDRHAESRIGVSPPKLRSLEDHRVDPLRVLALAMRIGVGEDVAALTLLYDAELAAGIARQPRVTGRIHIAAP